MRSNYVRREDRARIEAIKPDLMPLSSKANHDLAGWLEDILAAYAVFQKATDELEIANDRYPKNIQGEQLTAFIDAMRKKIEEAITNTYVSLYDRDVMEGIQEAAEDAMYAAQEREDAEE